MKDIPHGFSQLHVITHAVVADAVAHMRSRTTTITEFRTHARTIARALTYEATRSLPSSLETIETPAGNFAPCRTLSAEIIVTPILRAGLGLLEGFLDIIPTASTGFVGMRRNEETLLPEEYYRGLPELHNGHFFLLDPMLATGGSTLSALRGLPHDHMASCTLLTILSAPEGVTALSEEFPKLRIFTAALDDGLDENGFIVPGLGDAGDRLCGT